MTETPKVSVIVPVYNAGKWLRRCVDSILEQTFVDFELLLIDDGSTDDSASICDDYAAADARVRVFHKPNGGASSARNAGMAEAKGEWIAFCDSDDLPDKEWLANYSVDNAGDVDIICQGFRADKSGFGVNRDRCEVSFEYDGSAEGLTELLIKHNAIGYVWCKLFKRQIIEENNIRFETTLTLWEDEVFYYLYIANVKRAISYKKTGYFYFLPDWNDKYRLLLVDKIHMKEQAVRALYKRFQRGEFQKVYNFLIDSLNYELMLEFNNSHKRIHLRQIRELAVNHPHSTRMSGYLKKIIRIDKTMTISWLALALHMKVKGIISRQ